MRLEPKSMELSESTDEVLVHLVLESGSEGAFRVLYSRHSPRLFRIACRMLASESDAEDVLQESWLRASLRLGSFQWRSTLGTWLASIVVNVSRDALDRRGRWVDVELEEQLLCVEPVGGADPVDMERAVASLPAGCRAAFVLHDIEGFTHEEIAEQLGYTVGTSKSQVFRARRALRRLLGGTAVEESKNAAS
jgi:RNA polymerase sigma-70 factor (ECF subfamily)